MRFSVDHDFHIHSFLSRCSGDAAQTPEAMLSYAARFGLKKICVTDHFWDARVPGASAWYRGQDLDHLRSILPLPEGEIRFCFGAETEMDRSFRLGIAPQTFDAFDFVIIPTTHLQMSGFTIQEGASEADRARLWVERLDALLKMPLPWRKIGIAHLTTPLIGGNDRTMHLRILERLEEKQIRSLFWRAARAGVGIELNFDSFSYTDGELAVVLRIYRLAKEAGCRFYLGSDAHHPHAFDRAADNFEYIIELLDLQESDKFDFE